MYIIIINSSGEPLRNRDGEVRRFEQMKTAISVAINLSFGVTVKKEIEIEINENDNFLSNI